MDADVQDGAPALLEQWHRRLRTEKGALQVGAVDDVPVLFGERLEWRSQRDPGAVHEDIQSSKRRLGLVDQRVGILLAADIALHHETSATQPFDLGRHLARSRLIVAAVDDDRRSFSGEADGDALADPAGRSCDDGDFTFESHPPLQCARRGRTRPSRARRGSSSRFASPREGAERHHPMVRGIVMACLQPESDLAVMPGGHRRPGNQPIILLLRFDDHTRPHFHALFFPARIERHQLPDVRRAPA